MSDSLTGDDGFDGPRCGAMRQARYRQRKAEAAAMRAEEEAREEAERLAVEREAERARLQEEQEREWHLLILTTIVEIFTDPSFLENEKIKDCLQKANRLLLDRMPIEAAKERFVPTVRTITDARRWRYDQRNALIRRNLLGRSDVGVGVPNTPVTLAVKNAMTSERIADPSERNADPVRHRDAEIVATRPVSGARSVTVTPTRYDVSGLIELPEAPVEDPEDESDQAAGGDEDQAGFDERPWLYDHEEAEAEEAEAIAFGLRPEPVIYDDDPDAEAFLRSHLGLDENGRVK